MPGKRTHSKNRTRPERRTRPRSSRRRFLGSVVAGVVAGGTGVATGQEEPIDPGQTIRLRAQVSGWRGQAPESIGGLRNPRLPLQQGETYTVEWTNVDGQPHTFTVQNNREEGLQVIQQLQSPVTTTAGQDGGQGNGGNQQTTQAQGTIPQGEAVPVTDVLAERGAVQRLRFEATGEVAIYRCTIHPNRMVGAVRTEG